MADKLIFPIGFDLEAGVNEAVKNIDATLIRIERRIKDKPLELKISGLSELDQSIKTLTESLARLNTVFAATANMQQQLTNSTQEQGKITANTSNTISRQLMEQERLNKALRDVYSEQERVNALLDRYHDTYDGQVESLIRLNNALEANKQAQKDNEKALKDHSITSAEFYARQKELTAQYRQLTQEKRTLNQIMTAEEKAMQTQEGSYVQLSQQLSLLKKAYKELGEEGRTSVFGQDLEGAIQNLDAHLKDMAADMGEFQRNVGNYAIAGQNGVVTTESLTAAINQEARTTQDLIDQTRILEDAKRMINREDANYNSTIAALNAKLDENRRKLSDVSDILGKEAKSVAEAEAQNKRLSEAMKHIDLTSSDAKKKLEEMRSQIERNNRTISAATGANERYAESVLGLVGVNANFGRSLQGLGNGGNFIDGLGIKIKALGKSVMGLLANPWVLAILGIAGVAAGFKWWYEYNKGLIEASRLTENFTGLTGEAADKITADMQTLADHMGKGYKESIGAANVLVQQFGVSWEEAMKLMQDGIVAGADMSGNMVSNIERFAPALRDAGVSADEFMSILAETRNGIFNEQGLQYILRGGTRLKSMTKQVEDSLNAVGISSKKMQKDLSDGTINMFQAVQMVAEKLKELPENSQEAGNLMKHIFGRFAAEGGTLLIQSIADVNTNLEEAKKRMAELGEANEAQLNAQRELNEALSAVFKMSGTTFEVMMINAKTFVLEGLTKIIRGCVDIVNWFIRMYNGSIAVRGGVSSIVNSFQTLWEISKFVVNQIIDSFTAAGTILEGVVTLDWNKVKQGYSDGMKALGNNITTLAKNIASNTADAFNDTLNGQMKEVSVKLDADTSGATPARDGSGDGNSGGITPIGGKVDKEAAKTYLQTLNKIEQSITAINAKYNELAKKEGNTKALEHINELYKTQLDYINELGRQFGLSFKMPTSFKDLQDYRTAILDVINKLRASGLEGANKAALELEMKIVTGNIDNTQKQIESELKALADRISRTKTAKEFYEKILEQTGDIDIATRVSMSVYGSTGEELFNDTVEQIKEAFKTGSEEHPIDLDISAAIDLENQRIDYKKLADIYEKYQNEIIEKRRDTAKKIAQEGQKEVATDILNWRKSLAKAKSYEQKRTDIINTETAERAKIIRETTDPKERGELLGLSYSKQAQELAKLAVDEFKSSDDYIKVFQDLDRVSTQTLDRMKKRLEEMIATVKDTENVEGLKALVEQLDKIKEERETRNPIEGIIDSFKEYAKARKDYRTAEAEEAAAKAEFAQQEVGLNMAIQTAKGEQAIAQQRVNDLKAQGKENTSEGVAAELALNEATKKVTQAEENRNKAVKKVNNAEKKRTDALDAQEAALAKLQKNVNAMANAFNSAASSIKTIADMMGIAEDSELGDIVNGLVSGLNNAATIMTTILAIAIAIEAACWWMLAIGAAVAAFSAIGSWLTGSKVRKANKEIERQQKLLDQLDYTYGRLEKSADRAFGRDYVNNYNQQLKNLQAQQQAYLKQAEAERSKGKKADKDKIKEYEKQAREAADEIADMQGRIAERMAGTDLTSAARDFANAWLEAYASFGDTTGAIKEKFNDMIKSMVVESIMAKTVQTALTPLFAEIDEMYAGGASMTDVLVATMKKANALTTQITDGLAVNASELEALGINVRALGGESDGARGISKEVSNATSEEVNAMTAALNTQNYYASWLPTIGGHVAQIAQRLGAASNSTPAAGAGPTEMQQRAMNNLDMIARHTGEILEECRRSAAYCENVSGKIDKVVKVQGNSWVVKTYMIN